MFSGESDSFRVHEVRCRKMIFVEVARFRGNQFVDTRSMLSKDNCFMPVKSLVVGSWCSRWGELENSQGDRQCERSISCLGLSSVPVSQEHRMV